LRASLSPLPLALLLLGGCPSDGPTAVIIPNDDDTTAADDDDATAADDDDSTAADDDDSTAADDDDATSSWTLTITADAPIDAVVAVQDGDGPFVTVPIADMTATVTLDDPEGRYGVLLACAGTARTGVQVHLSDAATEPAPMLGCAEGATRDVPNGLLSGDVLNTENLVWSYYLGSRPRATVPGTVTEYGASLPVDLYDLVAVRREPNGSPNRVWVQRLLDAAADPLQAVDFNDSGSGQSREPEAWLLDIDSPAAGLSTTGVFVTRGGTVWPLGSRTGAEPSFLSMTNENRFSTDMIILRTDGTEAGGCTTRALSVLSSDRLEDFNTSVNGRHGSPIVPIETPASAICGDFSALAITAAAASLGLDWATGLGADHELDSLAVELVSGDGATRWSVTTSAARSTPTLDLADLGAVLGGAVPAPTAGWTWTATAWEHPAPAVTASHIALLLNTALFNSIPKGRTRFQMDPIPLPGVNTGVRNHEYDDDDLTREFALFPWDSAAYTAHGVSRAGTL
jgi:hypothetical protein